MNAVARTEPRDSRSLATTTGPTPGELLRIAVEQKADPTYLRELMQLQREYEADLARKAYVASMAAFKAEPLAIGKDKHVAYQKKDGTWVEYDHATIGNVVSVICAGLGRHGFSHRWDTQQGDAGRITVTCIITHADGHKESTALSASPDDSGSKNNIQAVASTVTYLQRYTLLAATGMATSDQDDDDGRGAGGENNGEPFVGAETNAAETEEARRIIADLFVICDQGREAFAAAWKGMSKDARRLVSHRMAEFEARCAKASP